MCVMLYENMKLYVKDHNSYLVSRHKILELYHLLFFEQCLTTVYVWNGKRVC